MFRVIIKKLLVLIIILVILKVVLILRVSVLEPYFQHQDTWQKQIQHPACNLLPCILGVFHSDIEDAKPLVKVPVKATVWRCACCTARPREARAYVINKAV